MTRSRLLPDECPSPVPLRVFNLLISGMIIRVVEVSTERLQTFGDLKQTEAEL